MIPAGNYTQDNEVKLYDCIVDHFKQERMLVVYEDEKFVASTSISMDRMQDNNTVQAFDLGVCPPCFAETDYIVNKYNAYTEYYEVTTPRFCFVWWLTGSEMGS